jgi:hypothetical protein
MIVMVFMGFGVVALANMFQSALRTYTKSEERYVKQEAVKTVAEYLQHATNIGVATKAEIYANSSVVPTIAGDDDSHAYIYVEKQDRDGDGVYDGFYLYKLERGLAKANAVCLNDETPLYITFDAYQAEDYTGEGEIHNQCGVDVTIAAVDMDFSYGNVGDLPETNDELDARIQDYIFFKMDVSYHFPNMITSNDTIRVNLTNAKRDSANVYKETGRTGNTVEAVDFNGQVLRITSDSSISADEAVSAVSVSSFCFIATAGYGEATGEVGILCDFRDQCLLTNPLGRMFVKAYYTISPPIADFIRTSEPLKAAVRVGLKPLVAVAVYALEPSLLADEIPYIILGMVSIGGIVGVGIKCRHKKKIEE